MFPKTLAFQERMASMFGFQRPVISKYQRNTLQEKKVGSILEHSPQHGAIAAQTHTQKVKHYLLDAISCQ